MANTKHKRASRIVGTAGHQGATVSIVPRDGYPTQAQAQWRHPSTGKRQRRTIGGVTLSTGGTATSREQRTHLQQLALLLHTRLEQGQPMPGEAGCPSWSYLLSSAAPKKKGQVNESDSDMLTVREALAIAYGPSYADKVNTKGRINGSYVFRIKGTSSGGLAVSTWTDHARDLRRLADVIESVLGADSPWRWSEATYTQLRDALIARVAENTQQTAVPQKLRRVQKVLQTYIRATRLVQKAFKDRDDIKVKPKALVIERWLIDLKAAWTAARLYLPEEEQPRYTRIEAGKIYAEGTSGRHDPRYGLWLLLGMEGRPVQILRARRSHLEDCFPDTPRGVFRGPGTQLKHGLIYAPTPAHRVKIDEYLHGYLRQYEAKYQCGEIEDYPLFVSGDLSADMIAPFRSDVRPWGYRQFLGDAASATGYYAIEKAAEVKNVPGRGPYALKYTVADLTPVVAGKLGIGDAVAVNLATAHDTPGTAPQYRRKMRSQPGVLVTVGRIIWEVRKQMREAAHTGLLEDFGLNSESERIRRYRVIREGIIVQTMDGDDLWVPWMALCTMGRQDYEAVEKLIADPSRWDPQFIDLDDDARELRLAGGVVLELEPYLIRARGLRRNGISIEDSDGPMFVQWVW